ncbi:MAG: acetyltransferase [Zetaproteobacteria bacterium CG_4_9_14_3_um_filter_49_83]|nr:MAG: acetyltransferase [Zetaproteobacteria bacterium CG1_02_49_23]PIQ32184.1 MAG: acetyltransferase [Zetaproteobacteria bacterium CG17_big_fil_post_rev_8_21_14_2_50_50_13]PIV30784.1 MAG: acetyltransferase [Zetaproteobacteria bacterium CG02_land_8_20_14_3_00_50_9]PIY57107.1 MAG: acetyltransferase [Zetaproteobacteria bacterium CG_4_10_14_0_8_um_filter_49_80]PJA35526.1 MAG: acetyltransferase [Zetaproteobacteria bacterium CG_4_9_14_3_um_filter_49_83]
MINFDVFNGDADGICALHQLRLAEPKEAELITGVKRDIALCKRVLAGQGDLVTVLDISFDKNRDEVVRLIDAGASVRYFDHHFAGELPASDLLETYIDTSADICTSLLVNDYLNGAYLPWAVTAAFGDNLFDSARKAAAPLELDDMQLQQLEQLGTLINYNGYGVTLEDLYFPPAELFRAIQPYESPFDFIAQAQAYQVLAQGFESDMKSAEQSEVVAENNTTAVLMLPDEAWARRVSGVYGNQLARDYPDRAHALVTVLEDGSYRISVRAPMSNKSGADELCMRFPTGGGRKAAAGINALPSDMLDEFIAAFQQQY